MLTLLLATALTQQSDFGWTEPIWEREYSRPVHDWAIESTDFTGDGINEIVVLSSVEHYSLEILNGADGSTWFDLPYPGGDPHSYLRYAEDLDGDGIAEFILGSPYFGGSGVGYITVVHGGDGHIMWQVWGRETNDLFGDPIHFADLDGDGFKDIFAGSRIRGKAVALNGMTGSLLWMQYGQGRGFQSITPDYDGDGIADIFLGGRNRFSLLSGATGTPIWDVSNQVVTLPREWQALYSDSNQDGVSDIWVLHPSESSGSGSRAGAIEVIDGTDGTLLWSAVGQTQDDRLGFDALLLDVNQDGVKDLFSRHPHHPSLTDGRTGALIWERRFLFNPIYDKELKTEDFNADGVPDFVAMDQINGSTVVNRLELINGVDGTAIWMADTQWPRESFVNLTLADFDQDGVSDILAVSPDAETTFNYAGLLRLISGATGGDLWQRSGDAADSQLGSSLFLEEIDAIPGPDVVSVDLSSSIHAGRMAISGISGLELWRVPFDPLGMPFTSLHAVDLNGDGRSDLLESQWDHFLPNHSRFQAFDGQDGAELWTIGIDSEGASPVTLFSLQPDIDGDGIGELVFRVEGTSSTYALQAHSGAGGGWTSGLELSRPDISVSAGGVVEIDIHFPAKQAGWDYQLLLSENGTQSTSINGLLVPLSSGFWLSSTYTGKYPSGLFFAQIGSLDDSARAQVTLNALPNQISPAFIGTIMYAAVISAEAGSPWSFSSGSAAVEILP